MWRGRHGNGKTGSQLYLGSHQEGPLAAGPLSFLRKMRNPRKRIPHRAKTPEGGRFAAAKAFTGFASCTQACKLYSSYGGCCRYSERLILVEGLTAIFPAA